MPRAHMKPEAKGPRPAGQTNGPMIDNGATATAVAEPMPEELAACAPPVEAAEPAERSPARSVSEKDKADKDHIASSLNIAKLQAMSMTELNQMARELENWGMGLAIGLQGFQVPDRVAGGRVFGELLLWA